MKTKFYLTVNKSGSVKVTKNATRIDMNEISLGMTLELPDVLFRRPQIQANITIAEDVMQPFFIDAETSNMVKDAIEQSTGMEVKLTVINPELA